eukprot:2657488-Amphidinium_carterae.1
MGLYSSSQAIAGLAFTYTFMKSRTSKCLFVCLLRETTQVFKGLAGLKFQAAYEKFMAETKQDIAVKDTEMRHKDSLALRVMALGRGTELVHSNPPPQFPHGIAS